MAGFLTRAAAIIGIHGAAKLELRTVNGSAFNVAVSAEW
jgi:hypothetical protein